MTCVYHCIRVTCQVIHRSPFLFGQFMEIHFVSLGLVSVFLRVSCYFFVLISAFEKTGTFACFTDWLVLGNIFTSLPSSNILAT